MAGSSSEKERMMCLSLDGKSSTSPMNCIKYRLNLECNCSQALRGALQKQLLPCTVRQSQSGACMRRATAARPRSAQSRYEDCEVRGPARRLVKPERTPASL